MSYYEDRRPANLYPKDERLHAALRDAGIDFAYWNSGGGCMITVVEVGGREVTINDDAIADDEYLAVVRPYVGHLAESETDDDTEDYPDITLADLLTLIANVAEGSDDFAERRLVRALDQADGAFWEAIAKAYPEVKTGDFGPGETALWNDAIRSAVETWLSNNRPVAEEV